MADSRELAIGIIRLIGGRGASVALNFVGWAVIARTLGPDSFGVLQFAISVVFYLSFATDLGLTTYGTREFAAGGRQERVVATVVGVRILLAVAATAIAVLGSLVLTPVGEERDVALLVSAVISAGAINMLWLLRAQGRSTALALQDVGSAAALAGGAVLVVAPTGSAVLAAGVYAVAQWLAAIMSIRSVGGLSALRPTFSGAFHAVTRAIPLGIAVLAVNVYYTADSVLLGVLRTDAEVGLYGAAYRLVMPWLMVASVAGLLAMPALARLIERSSDEVGAVVRGLSRSLLIIAVPVAAGTTVMAGFLVELVFGPSYSSAALPLSILIWSAVTVFGNAPFGFLILARRQDRAYMWIAIAGALTNLVLNAVLIPSAGMTGAAAATIAAEVVVLIAMVWTARDVSPGVLASSLPSAAVVGGVTAAAMWPFRDSVIGLVVGGVAFLGAGAATGALPVRSSVALARRAVPIRRRAAR